MTLLEHITGHIQKTGKNSCSQLSKLIMIEFQIKIVEYAFYVLFNVVK